MTIQTGSIVPTRREGVFALVSRPSGEQIVDVAIAALRPADSPRISGEDQTHVRTLAETDAELPPILVQRSTMRVIDGAHRVAAARLRGADTVRARFFDGDDAAAFLLAVKSNVLQGLPLTLAERKQAAKRIVTSHPQWSDRAIAAVVGLDHKTVGSVRRCLIGEIPQSVRRIGRDGRVRPVDNTEGRTKAGQLIAEFPHASIRQIAQTVGMSTATVQDVRKRVRHGADPVPARAERSRGQQAVAELPRTEGGRDRATVIKALRTDPSLRFTDSGRALLRWLDACAAPADWDALVTALPPHAAGLVAEVAQSFATQWQQFALRLSQVDRSA
ncbi:MAG TPA: ParB N-terminal domain-containing protein [Pseudonocardiaceae bacterium]|nr:ParB N-terminal domain-containing protein [Pseudonocardiaceae bacterium]